MLVKICGITKPEEIKIANEEKPDFVGFVFAESKRKIDTFLAKELIKNLDKNIKTVGVFRNNTFNEILNVLKEIDIDIIQLHGNEDNDFINKLKEKSNCTIWKAFSIKSKDDIKAIEECPVDTIILDGSDPGSGKTFNWNHLDKFNINKNIIIAGGINEDNVLKAIDIFKPIAVDMSSSVERIDERGIRIKDKDKIHRIISKVR